MQSVRVRTAITGNLTIAYFNRSAAGQITESLMQPLQVDHAGDSRLRFVFNDTVVSFSVAADVTFGEVARTLDELSNQRYGNPVAIDVTLGFRQGDSAARSLAKPAVSSHKPNGSRGPGEYACLHEPPTIAVLRLRRVTAHADVPLSGSE